MTEIISKRAVPNVNWIGVPEAYVGKASAVLRSLQDCEDLVKWFGNADFCPILPVLVHAPGGWTAITGLGYATVAELQDCAIYTWTNQQEKLARMGALWDFNALREKNGLMRKEDVPAAMSDALTRRIAHHKANPVTDPARQPVYPRVNGRTLHTVAKVEG